MELASYFGGGIVSSCSVDNNDKKQEEVVQVIEELNVNGNKNYILYDKEFDIEKDYEIILNQYKEILGNNVQILDKKINSFKLKQNNKEKVITLNIEQYFSIEYDKSFTLNTQYSKDNYFKKGTLVEFSAENDVVAVINEKALIVKDNSFSFNIDKKTKIEKGFYIEVDTEQGSKIIEKNLANQDFVLLDVRTKAEFEEGHLYNAVQLDFRKLDLFIEEIKKLDKNKTYFIYCRTDNRSREAVKEMHKVGFKNIFVMLGGYTKWAKELRDRFTPEKNKNSFVFNVENLEEKYNINDNLDINITLTTDKDFNNKNIILNIYDNEKNKVKNYSNIELGETKEFEVKISEEIKKVYKKAEYTFNQLIDNSFNKPFYYIEIIYNDGNRNYTYFKLFDVNILREAKTFEDYKNAGLYDHLNEPLSDLSLSKLKERFGEVILNNQAYKENLDIINLYNEVDLDKNTVLIMMSPLCGSCIDLWSSLSAYDFKNVNMLPLITSILKENPRDSIDDALLGMQNDEDLKKLSVYDGVNFVWQNMDFITTPKYLLLDKKGRLVNYIKNDPVEDLISLIEKTLDVKIPLKNSNQSNNENHINTNENNLNNNEEKDVEKNNKQENTSSETETKKNNSENKENQKEDNSKVVETNTNQPNNKDLEKENNTTNDNNSGSNEDKTVPSENDDHSKQDGTTDTNQENPNGKKEDINLNQDDTNSSNTVDQTSNPNNKEEEKENEQDNQGKTDNSNNNQSSNVVDNTNEKQNTENSDNSNTETKTEYIYDDTPKDGLLTEEKTAYIFEKRVEEKHFLDLEKNPNIKNIIERKYKMDFSEGILKNIKEEVNYLKNIRGNKKLKLLIFLSSNNLEEQLEKINSNIEKIKEYISYLDIYFIFENLEKEEVLEKTNIFEKEIKENLFYFEAHNIITKLDYSYFPLVVVLDLNYALTDIFEFDNLFTNKENIIDYAKKLSNTYSIETPKIVNKTYEERKANQELNYIDYYKRLYFEQKDLYGLDLSEYEMYNINGEKVKIKDLNKNGKLTILMISKINCSTCHGAWKEAEIYIKEENMLEMFNYIDFVTEVKNNTTLKYSLAGHAIKDNSHFFYDNKYNYDFSNLILKSYPTFLLLDENNKVTVPLDFSNFSMSNLKILYEKIKGTNSVKNK